MSIAIVTDSASYLTPAQVEQFNITVLPITVILGDHQYPESQLPAQTFYNYLQSDQPLPTTAQVSLGQIETAYDRLVAQGVTQIISIHLSSGITSFLSNLKMFCQTYTKAEVYPIDSLVASAGEANLCLLAGRLIAAGYDAPAIAQALTTFRDTQHIYFAVDSLKHLARTGRLTNRSAMIGNLLNIKPLLTFNDAGEIIAIGKERTMRRAFRFIDDQLATTLKTVDYPLHATVIDANNPELGAQWRTQLEKRFPAVRFSQSQLGPAISVHTGEKTMGLIWQQDWQEF
ncbi:MAG TPA: DegV family protein [Candidatus Levilactobacillus faecigallinarum]|uniref:DegV family protein n=1 Tax=Candidatus Levilactobacillus faecigallinarum TaxID=2838638 RepID=A0A9D1QTN7_9LACO|nr:DegV family protein [Candidatus Levilactobacillus faecigallinarum]